jgi:hypothetical protein
VLDTNKALKGADFEAMVRAAARFIDAKRSQDQVAMLALDNSGEGYSLLSNFDREPSILGRRLADLQPRSDKTRLYDGVAAAMQMAGSAVGGDSSSDVEYVVSTSIIVLGSGRDDDSAINRSDLMTRISGLKIPAPIYSLGFGAPESKEQRNLQALAKNSFGKHYPIGGALRHHHPQHRGYPAHHAERLRAHLPGLHPGGRRPPQCQDRGGVSHRQRHHVL